MIELSKVTTVHGGEQVAFVSVIIPVFNDEIGVSACLEGLRRQTMSADSFEVVIVDNRSQPALQIDGNFQFDVRTVFCATPGSYAARNAGTRLASGQTFAFVDADCVPGPDWLASGLQAISNQNGKAVIGGDVIVNTPTIRNGIGLYQSEVGFQQRENIEQKAFTATANIFCTAEQFRTVGYFDERLLSGGDREWSWRAARVGLTVVFEPRSVVLTAPRMSLRSAVRQARRVAAGREAIKMHKTNSTDPQALRPHRSYAAALRWILMRKQLSFMERLKVLFAAAVLKCAALTEIILLRFGFAPERR